MPTRPDDAGLFIRSVTAPKGHEGIAGQLEVMIHLLRAFRFDVVLIETAGAGQGDTAVRDLADVLVLLLQPETGDEFQWEKAGLLEVADLVGALETLAQVKGLLNLPGCRPVAVLAVSSEKRAGLEELWDAVEAVPGRKTESKRDAGTLLSLAQERLAGRFLERAGDVGTVLERWRRRELADGDAADEVIRAIGTAR
jgi:putative protein kinase ArgK-like GTPase of G3E family